MADIAFLLIVFFMVTTTISVDRTTVQLPTSMERGETPKDSAVIVVEENGVVHFSDGEEGSRVVNPSDILTRGHMSQIVGSSRRTTQGASWRQ